MIRYKHIHGETKYAENYISGRKKNSHSTFLNKLFNDVKINDLPAT